jgi:hypothetical protein
MSTAGSHNLTGSQGQPSGDGPGILGQVLAWCRRRPVVAALLACIVLQTVMSFGLVAWQSLEMQRLRSEIEELRKARPEGKADGPGTGPPGSRP